MLINKLFLNNLIKLSVISIVLFTPIFLLAEWFFPLFFGSEWQIAGLYAKILTPLMAIRFVVSTLSISLVVIEKQAKELLIHFGVLFATTAVWCVSYYMNLNALEAVKAYSVGLSTIYLIILGYIYFSLRIYNSKMEHPNL